MPQDKSLFTLTQGVLRMALIGNVVIIALVICTAAAIALRVDTMIIPPAKFIQGAQDISGEIARGLSQELNTHLEVNISSEQMTEAAHKIAALITRDDLARLAVTLLAGCAAGLVLLQLILRAILRIVDSACVGDPFVAENAGALERIACLLLGIYAVEYITGLAVHALIPGALNKLPMLHSGHAGEIPFTGLFTVLLIFVLAQIFRRGAEMRAELEGTV